MFSSDGMNWNWNVDLKKQYDYGSEKQNVDLKKKQMGQESWYKATRKVRETLPHKITQKKGGCDLHVLQVQEVPRRREMCFEEPVQRG